MGAQALLLSTAAPQAPPWTRAMPPCNFERKQCLAGKEGDELEMITARLRHIDSDYSLQDCTDSDCATPTNSEATASPFTPSHRPPSFDLTHLPGDVLLKCIFCQRARLRCRAVSRSLKHHLEISMREWSLSSEATDQTVESVTKAFGAITQLSINPEGSLVSPCRGVNGAGMAALGSLRSLRKLDLNYLTELDQDDLSRLAEGQLPLESLRLEFGLAMTERSAQTLAAACPALTTLSVGISSLNDAGLTAILSQCPALTDIALRNCHAITDEGLNAIASWCPDLKRLQIANSKQVTDDGMIVVAFQCHKLQKLDISQSEIGDQTLCALGLSCPELKALNISWCVNVTHDGLMAVTRGCSDLKDLKLTGCCKLNSANVEEAVSGRPVLAEAVYNDAAVLAPNPKTQSTARRNSNAQSTRLCDSWFSNCNFNC